MPKQFNCNVVITIPDDEPRQAVGDVTDELYDALYDGIPQHWDYQIKVGRPIAAVLTADRLRRRCKVRRTRSA